MTDNAIKLLLAIIGLITLLLTGYIKKDDIKQRVYGNHDRPHHHIEHRGK